MQLLLNEAIYQKVIVGLLPQTERYLWIVTADIKDLHVPKGKRFVPLLEIFSDLIDRGVSVRLMHAKEPGPRFRADFDRLPPTPAHASGVKPRARGVRAAGCGSRCRRGSASSAPWAPWRSSSTSTSTSGPPHRQSPTLTTTTTRSNLPPAMRGD